jgi:hypothetical protein
LTRGQVLVVFGAAVVVLAGMCAMTTDVGLTFVCRAQLQNAVDAAALAGASQLKGIVSAQEKDRARAEAKALALANSVGGMPLTLADEDIEFGHCNPQTMIFVPEPSATVVDSIRVRGRRSADSPDGPIGLFFAKIFGRGQVELRDVDATGTKPRRYVMFVLDRSGSMCFDTPGVQLEPTLAPQDGVGPYFRASASGWYWFPDAARRVSDSTWYSQTAWFYARDDATGNIRTDFLPDHVRTRLDSGQYFNFRSPDYPTQVMSGWIKVPAGVTIYGRWASPWDYWLASTYYHVISSSCGYARSTGPVQPLQDTMDAACAFVDLLSEADDMAGLVTYASKSVTDQVLTRDFDALKVKLQSFAPCGATAEPDAMTAANAELIDSGRAEGFGHRIQILLTDGCANMLREASYDNSSTRTYQFLGRTVTTTIHPTVAAAMEQEARRARDAGIKIYCVTFGSATDAEVHRQISIATNGAYYYAAEHSDLADVFVDIFRRLPAVLTQ